MTEGDAAPTLAAAAGDAAGEHGDEGGARRRGRERPSLGIRFRLVLGFLSFFVLAVGVTVTAWIMLTRLEVRLRFLEVADRYTMEIQQARRFEKNYLLYGSNLRDVSEHVDDARALLEAAGADPTLLAAAGELARMRGHLDRYASLITELSSMPTGGTARDALERGRIETELRAHGSQMVSVALQLAERERAAVNRTLALFKRLPVAFMAFLLVFSVIVADFLARQMIRPLSRLMTTTERIGKGDFTPLAPVRWYRDEFSKMAVALNTMMRELTRRHDVLVRSHKLTAVGTLTAGVAHELNNPINNITLTAEVLREDYATLGDAERLEMVDDLVAQAGRAQKIVRNLLDFAREGEITTERIDVAELLCRTASLAANQIKLSGVKIALDVPANLRAVHGDVQSLTQVFVNLVLNALDAVGRGGHVRIHAANAREPGWIEVAVSDDGAGIAPHVLPRIFDPFFTTKSRGKGTGLGLSVSLGIVRQHGGDIVVESGPGRGSTFTVVLPASQVPGAGNGEALSRPSPPSARALPGPSS
jgi:two-component system, NtrC family, sensor kinase